MKKSNDSQNQSSSSWSSKYQSSSSGKSNVQSNIKDEKNFDRTIYSPKALEAIKRAQEDFEKHGWGK